MKLKVIYLMFLLLSSHSVIIAQSAQSHEEELESVSDGELMRLINPTIEEQEFAYTIVPPPPPSTFIIWLRKVGIPLVNAYFSARRVVRHSWHWLVDHLAIKIHKVSHEKDA